MSQPLSDSSVLIEQPAASTAAPQSRAGNAMQRARSGILAAAAALIADQGLQGVTMVGVARRAGIAKATVYNHVRDRDELLALALVDQWRQLQQVCANQPPSQRLGAAATWVSESRVLRGLRMNNPEALVAVAEVAMSRADVRQVVTGWIPEGRDPEAALRWLISFGLAPSVTASVEPAG